MRAGLLLCVLASAPLVAGATSPSEIVQQCASSAPPGSKGLQSLKGACPALGAALDELGVAPLLSTATRDNLTPATLADATHLATARALRPRPNVGALPPILRAIASPAERRGAWARFLEWLRQYLGRHLPANESTWLTRLLSAIDVGPDALRLVLYGLVTVVLAGAGWIVYRELKAAGVLQRRAARAARNAGTPPDTVPLGGPDSLPAGEPIGLLFGRVVARLEARSGASVRARTHRQLRDSAQLPDPASARRFATLACVAEEQLYAPAPVSTDRRDAALADGAALYDTLAGHPRP